MRVAFGVFLVLVGCGRSTEYLYHLTDLPPERVTATHKIKELEGENKVDILWVIDNSGSMGTYQAELAKNADIFIKEFVKKGGLDWKMGIISTDYRQDPYIGFTSATELTFKTPGNVKLFQDAVRRLGTNGDATERTFTPLQDHLKKFPTFLRKNASFALIMLTDAVEQSGVPAKDVLTFLAHQKGDIKRVVAYGVFAAMDFGCMYTDGGFNYAGSPYETVIKATQGKVYKLCNTDFGKNLADLGQDLVGRVKRPFIALKARPRASTLRVTYKDKDLPGGTQERGGYWVYDFELNRVVFHSLDFAPGDEEEVVLSYETSED